MYSCIINWLQFDSNSSFTFSCVCLIYKNDSFVLYTCLVEMHFWLVNPDHVLAIWPLTSKVKFEHWININKNTVIGFHLYGVGFSLKKTLSHDVAFLYQNVQLKWTSKFQSQIVTLTIAR